MLRQCSKFVSSCAETMHPRARLIIGEFNFRELLQTTSELERTVLKASFTSLSLF